MYNTIVSRIVSCILVNLSPPLFPPVPKKKLKTTPPKVNREIEADRQGKTLEEMEAAMGLAAAGGGRYCVESNFPDILRMMYCYWNIAC